ncbi:uracil-DNA glycosylase family protein, partial [uncultured Campylobacter sp.]
MNQTHPFKPIFDKNSKILIIGSFPSVVSRKFGFYYANPQNRFWRVLAQI